MAESQLTSSDLWIAVLSSSLLATIFGALVTQWYKIRTEKGLSKYQQKEERFFNLVTDIGGFRDERSDPERKERVYDAYRQLWLYASDETIRKINDLFFSQGAARLTYDELAESSKGQCELVLQIRKDFFGQTTLRPEDYQIVLFREERSVTS